jgi:hypothetical protein
MADHDEAAGRSDSAGVARGTVTHDGRYDQGHREDVGAQAILEAGLEGDVLAKADDRGNVVIRPPAGRDGTVEHCDAQAGRGLVQAG